MKVTKLNEDYFDSHEYRITRYEDELADLLPRLHSYYKSGMLNAKAYADALQNAFNAFDGLDLEDDDSLSESSNSDKDTKNQLEIELKKRHLKINPEKNSIDAAVELIDAGGNEYSVNQWINDTLQNYPDHLIKEDITNESFDNRSDIDLDLVGARVANLLDVDKLGEENWIELFCNYSHRYEGTDEVGLRFKAFGENKTLTGSMKTNNGRIDVKFDNGSEAKCNSAEEIARFVAGEFGVTLD